MGSRSGCRARSRFRPGAGNRARGSKLTRSTLRYRISSGRSASLRQQQRRQNSPPVEVQTGPVSGHPVSAKKPATRSRPWEMGRALIAPTSAISTAMRPGRMRAESPKTVEILDPVRWHTIRTESLAKKTYIRGDMTRNPQYMSVAVYGDSTVRHPVAAASGCSGA